MAYLVSVAVMAGISMAYAIEQNTDEVHTKSSDAGCVLPARAKSGESATTYVYVSSSGERLIASYDGQTDSVILNLADGSTARLPQVISGSGARYADDRMVFWEHQGEASLWIGEKLIFKGR